jgi:nicotinamide-nucleotide amidase
MRNFKTLLVCLGITLLAAQKAGCAEITNELRYFIVVTGGELLEGAYPDAHTHYITRTLFPLGADCVGSLFVDDDRASMLSALRFATNRASVVIVTGGLGPTANDITREVISEFAGITLEEDQTLLTSMEKRLNESSETLRPNLRKQAKVPGKGNYLKNSSGTAAGLLFNSGNTIIAALPGPPRELQPMVKEELLPFFQKRFFLHEHTSRVAVRFYGIGQSLISQTIKDKINLPENTITTSFFEGMRVDFFFTLPGSDPATKSRLQKIVEDLRHYLGTYVYAEDEKTTLEEAALKSVGRNGRKMVILDLATEGMVASLFNTARGSSNVLQAVYSTSQIALLAKMIGTEKTSVPDLAKAAANRTGANFVLFIGQISGTSIPIYFGVPGELIERSVPFQGNQQFAAAIFDLLRKEAK